MLTIERLGEDILRRVCDPVGDIDGELREFIDQMFDAMRLGKGVGLAAPQVGRTIRLFVTYAPGDKPRAFINPEIVQTSPEEAVFEEGCLSIPGVYADVKRSAAIRIQAYNEKGRPFALDADDFLARVILHEYDHLDGKLFIDKLSDMKRERLLKQYEKLERV
jgi:peptide deformylase